MRDVRVKIGLLAGVGVIVLAVVLQYVLGPGGPVRRGRGDHRIIVCGQAVPIDARVVLWSDPGGFNAYLEHGWADVSSLLPTSPASGCDTPRRYGTRSCLLDADGNPLDVDMSRQLSLIRDRVDQIVLHYDAAGSSRRCFEVLHDERGLSAHFLVDVDGTIYQTLDVRERARHAGPANDRSIGVEIANVGAYETLDELLKVWPLSPLDSAAPDLPEPITGMVQGKMLLQFPFNDAQYRAVSSLVEALCSALPKLRPVAPCDDAGRLIDRLMPMPALLEFSGVLGHFHVSGLKVDPGPAFDWTRVVTNAVASGPD